MNMSPLGKELSRTLLKSRLLTLLLVSVSLSSCVSSNQSRSSEETVKTFSTTTSVDVDISNNSNTNGTPSGSEKSAGPPLQRQVSPTERSTSTTNERRESDSSSNQPDGNQQGLTSADDFSTSTPTSTSFTCLARLVISNDSVPTSSQAVILRVSITKGSTAYIWYQFEVGDSIRRGILKVIEPSLTEMKLALAKNEGVKVGIYGARDFLPRSKACEASLP